MARAGVWYCWRWPGGCQQGLCRSFITDERYVSDDGLTGYDVGYDLSEKNLSFIRCQNGSSDSVWGILTGHGTISFTNGNANDIVDTALFYCYGMVHFYFIWPRYFCAVRIDPSW